MKNIILIFTAVSMFLFSCSKDEIENDYFYDNNELINFKVIINGNYEIIKDVSYGQGSLQTFDIHTPINTLKENNKIIVLIHGGSWINGDKSSMEELLERIKISNPNYTIVNMNYTLADNDTYAFPNQFNDIDALLNKLEFYHKNHKSLPEFALIGRSAGGQLALMYDYVYDKKDRVKTVCSISGPTDFTHSLFQEDPNFEYLFDLIVDKSEYPNETESVKELSPSFNVSIKSSPTILFHGSYDNKVPPNNAKTLSAALTNFKVPTNLFIFNENHGGWSESTMQVVDEELKMFLQKHF